MDICRGCFQSCRKKETKSGDVRSPNCVLYLFQLDRHDIPLRPCSGLSDQSVLTGLIMNQKEDVVQNLVRSCLKSWTTSEVRWDHRRRRTFGNNDTDMRRESENWSLPYSLWNCNPASTVICPVSGPPWARPLSPFQSALSPHPPHPSRPEGDTHQESVSPVCRRR